MTSSTSSATAASAAQPGSSSNSSAFLTSANVQPQPPSTPSSSSSAGSIPQADAEQHFFIAVMAAGGNLSRTPRAPATTTKQLLSPTTNEADISVNEDMFLPSIAAAAAVTLSPSFGPSSLPSDFAFPSTDDFASKWQRGGTSKLPSLESADDYHLRMSMMSLSNSSSASSGGAQQPPAASASAAQRYEAQLQLQQQQLHLQQLQLQQQQYLYYDQQQQQPSAASSSYGVFASGASAASASAAIPHHQQPMFRYDQNGYASNSRTEQPYYLPPQQQQQRYSQQQHFQQQQPASSSSSALHLQQQQQQQQHLMYYHQQQQQQQHAFVDYAPPPPANPYTSSRLAAAATSRQQQQQQPAPRNNNNNPRHQQQHHHHQQQHQAGGGVPPSWASSASAYDDVYSQQQQQQQQHAIPSSSSSQAPRSTLVEELRAAIRASNNNMAAAPPPTAYGSMRQQQAMPQRGRPGYSNGGMLMQQQHQQQQPQQPLVNIPFTLADIRGHAVELAQDQYGSRWLQQQLCSPQVSAQDKQRLFAELLPASLSLASDTFGNYCVQILLNPAVGTPEQQRQLCTRAFEGNIVELSRNTYACRCIQSLVKLFQLGDGVIPLYLQDKMLKELEPEVLLLVTDSNANHVCQQVIERIRPIHRIEFLLKSFQGNYVQLAKDPFGCRVCQRVLEHASEEFVEPALEELLEHMDMLVTDSMGNYVVQHIITAFSGDRYLKQRTRLVDCVKAKLLQFATHKFASNVVEKVLEYGDQATRREVIQMMLDTPANGGASMLQIMMSDLFANYVCQRSLAVADRDQLVRLVQVVRQNANELRRMTYGKHILAACDKAALAAGLS